MTNKEIKLEIAKVALEKCSLTSGTLMGAMRSLYGWIVEETDDEVETNQENQFDSADIKEVLNIIRRQRGFGNVATLLGTVFNGNNINTVGDLVRVGRHEFSKYRLVGKRSFRAVDDALEELGITAW